MIALFRTASACAIVLSLLASGRAATPDPIELNAILSLTGTAAESGGEEAQALHVVENVVNAHGGVRGRPIKLVIADDESSPQVAVQLVNGVIAKKASVVFGSTVTGT